MKGESKRSAKQFLNLTFGYQSVSSEKEGGFGIPVYRECHIWTRRAPTLEYRVMLV